MGKGFLKIPAFMGNNAIPITGAKITVTNSDNQIVSTTISDANGNTEIIELPAPDQALSLNSDFKGETYSLFSVEIQLANYLPIIYSGVQIMDGTTALLNVQMIPAPLNMYQENKIIEIKIPPIGVK